jgi:putative transposase
MAGQRFRKDMHILFRGREYVIDQSLPNRELRIKDMATNEYRPVPEIELVEALFDGELEFLGEDTFLQAQGQSARSYVQDLSILDEDDPKQKKRKEETRRKYRYVNEILTSSVSKLTKESLEPLINEVAFRIEDAEPPSWSTIYNWVRAYLKAGEDIRVLIPATDKRGNTKPMYSGTRLKKYTEKDKEKAEEVARIISLVVQEKYLSRQRHSILATHRFLEGRIKEINKFRKDEDKLPIPRKDSLYHYISKLDDYEIDAARFGQRYADRKHRQVMSSPRPTRSLERVEIDHTKTDLMVVDLETKLPIGRATLTDAIDVYTKMPFGSYISFEPPSYLSVMQCLLNAIKPKTYVKKLYPEVENEWNCYGLPELIIVDNGKEFHSLDFEDACLQLGIIVEYAPPGCPEYKGSKERYYETLNTQLLHDAPGTTFSNIFDRADYDPVRNALIDIESLKKIHHIYMIDIYARQIHKGISDVPARLWNESISVFPPALPTKGTDLKVLIGHVEYRKVRQQGIELFGLFYNCNELSVLRRETKGHRIKIKYDPTDISFIYVTDYKNGLFIPVPAVDQEYTRGLSLFQHDVIRRYARSLAKAFVDSDALWRARKKIEEIIEQAWNLPRKSSTRTKLARFKGIGLQNYWGAFEQVEVEQGQGHITSPQHTDSLLESNLDEAQRVAGISDLENALIGHSNESQPLQGNQNGLLHVEASVMVQTTNNRQQESMKQRRRNNISIQNNRETETETTSSKSGINGARDITDEAYDDAEWGADYGQMEEEILKWQKD